MIARDSFRRPHTSRASSAARLQTSHIQSEGSQEGLTTGGGQRGGGGGGRRGGRGGREGGKGLLSRSRTGALSHSSLRPTPFLDTPEMGQRSKSGGASLPDYVEVQGHAGLWGHFPSEVASENISPLELRTYSAAGGAVSMPVIAHVPFTFLWAGQRPIYERHPERARDAEEDAYSTDEFARTRSQLGTDMFLHEGRSRASFAVSEIGCALKLAQTLYLYSCT
jgi:hypothetical protein